MQRCGCCARCPDSVEIVTTSAARSIHVFGLYLLGLGVILVVAPNELVGLFGIPTTTEVWIHIVGVLVFFLGVYYSITARHGFEPFFLATV